MFEVGYCIEAEAGELVACALSWMRKEVSEQALAVMWVSSGSGTYGRRHFQ